MRLSDWSSDVCSSDRFWRGLPLVAILFMSVIMLLLFLPLSVEAPRLSLALAGISFYSAAYLAAVVRGGLQGIGRGPYESGGAWRRVRVCQYVEISGGAVSYNTTMSMKQKLHNQ